MDDLSPAGSLPAEGERATERRSAGRETGREHPLRRRLGPRSVVLVGLMGAGKSTVGRRLAAKLGLPFYDADHEIEAAAGMTIPEIFSHFGEEHFRDGERRGIAPPPPTGPAGGWGEDPS